MKELLIYQKLSTIISKADRIDVYTFIQLAFYQNGEYYTLIMKQLLVTVK